MTTHRPAQAQAQAPLNGLLHAKLPSRPLPAFNIFFQVTKKRMRKEKPQQSYADMLQEIKARWKTLSEQERTFFNEQASAEKVRFAHELLHWNRKQDEFLWLKRQARIRARGNASTDSTST